MAWVRDYETIELPGPVIRKQDLYYKLLSAVRLADYDLADRIAMLIEKIAQFEEYPPYYNYEGEPIGYIVNEDYTKAVAVVLIHQDKIMFFEVK